MEPILNDAITELISNRHDALKTGDIQRATEISNSLLDLGIQLLDHRCGTYWKLGGRIDTKKTAIFE